MKRSKSGKKREENKGRMKKKIGQKNGVGSMSSGTPVPYKSKAERHKTKINKVRLCHQA